MDIAGDDEAMTSADSGRGSSWTGGRQLGAKLTTAALFTCLLCGPAALVLAVNSMSKPMGAMVSAAESGLNAQQQSAGAFALGYVGAWLSASRADSGQLADYIDISSTAGISEVPWQYRDLAVSSIVPGNESELVTVVIAGNVREQEAAKSGDATVEIWPRRYYQVVVHLGERSARVVGMPAPVDGPGRADPAVLAYSSTLSSSDPAAEATMAFLGAYLADSGDISRYVTPGADILAIAPAPYVQIESTDIRVDKQPSVAPADDEIVKVLATVTLSNAFDQRLAATYALTLTARASRWEVSSLDLAPQETASKAANSKPTPTPTGAGTTKGN